MTEGAFASLRLSPLMTFKEEEGVTLVLSKDEAEKNKLQFSCPSRLITLTVHSSLEAVGFLAAFSAKLAGAGIGFNAVSAYYHDHLFVPEDRAAEALGLLEELAEAERGV